eukprot:scaffold847_cov172-Ochromonas_danica.AAC.18
MNEEVESEESEDSSSEDSSSYRFELHELIFAEQLGVDLEERFAGDLVATAAKALYVLPDGWEINFAQTDRGLLPYYYDVVTRQSLEKARAPGGRGRR